MTQRGALARIAGQLEIHPEALRAWVRGAEAADEVCARILSVAFGWRVICGE
jgi:transposase-like protein